MLCYANDYQLSTCLPAQFQQLPSLNHSNVINEMSLTENKTWQFSLNLVSLQRIGHFCKKQVWQNVKWNKILLGPTWAVPHTIRSCPPTRTRVRWTNENYRKIQISGGKMPDLVQPSLIIRMCIVHLHPLPLKVLRKLQKRPEKKQFFGTFRYHGPSMFMCTIYILAGFVKLFQF